MITDPAAVWWPQKRRLSSGVAMAFPLTLKSTMPADAPMNAMAITESAA
jgi:hypothetical protein